MKNKIIGLLALTSCAISSFAQPVPAEKQKEAILISNATAHIGNGKVIENALVGFENGKITLVADATTARIDRTKYKKIIDASGKHVYPGFIATNSVLGLVEVTSSRPTVDFAEIGEMNPSVRSLIAYNTDSYVLPTVRSNGVLLAQVVPDGGRISGQSSVVELDAWNWEDAAYAADNGLHLRFPAMNSGGFNFDEGFTQRKNERYAQQVQQVYDFFKEAQAYVQKANPMPKNLKFEAMKDVFSGKKTLFIHANAAKEITEGVQLSKTFGCRSVIVGGNDAWMVADFLKENNIGVILNETQSLPSRIDDDIDQPFKNPVLLQKAGVSYCLSSEGYWQQRNLPFMAGQAVGFGLAKEEAVSAITLNTAKILNIDKTVGSLEEGKDATLFISKGDALDMRTCVVEQAFIRGRNIDLDNKHKQLYQRFQTKYNRLKGK